MQRLLLLLLFVCVTASSQVYKRIGPDGKVYFSDRPGSDAEKVEVSPAQSISLPPVQETNAAVQQEDTSSSYTDFTIVSPTSDEGVRANDGNVTVQLLLQPELMSGHRIMLNIDGEDGEQITTGDEMKIELSNLSRGRHTVEAKVVDQAGNEFIQAGPISFNVLRAAGGGI